MNNKIPGIGAYAGGLIIDHLFALMASLVVNSIINFFSKSGTSALSFIICLVVYFLICYIDAWNRGCADSNRVRLGLLPKNDLRGVLAGLLAAIPGFLLAFLAFVVEAGFVSIYNILFEVDLFTAINRLWHYPIAALYIFANEHPVLNLAFPLFLPIVSGFGYILGLREITLKNIFIYKNENDEE